MKHYFLGAGANHKHVLKHLFTHAKEEDCIKLANYLSKKYGGEAILTKNGRSALCIALKAYFEKGDGIIVNGFTCYAVIEAIKVAGMVPIYADIVPTNLNYDVNTLEKALSSNSAKEHPPKAIFIQNSLGNPVDIESIEKFTKEHSIVIIEDLAHCAGVKYPDGREVGMVGDALALSFGKEKSIDTISGGAVVLRELNYKLRGAPSLIPSNPARKSDSLRARFYPLFGKMYRGLSYVKLNGILMRILLAFHWVEKSADNRLDITRKISPFEAKLALEQLKKLRPDGEPPLRKFYLINNRDEILAELRKNGYYFDGFWYERPVSPERYYKEVNFPEEECPNAVAVTQRIINIPNYYTVNDLAQAERIIREKGQFWSMENA
jgi:dTDP-4-amino-4,6-dideoxygalactose transaminase